MRPLTRAYRVFSTFSWPRIVSVCLGFRISLCCSRLLHSAFAAPWRCGRGCVARAAGCCAPCPLASTLIDLFATGLDAPCLLRLSRDPVIRSLQQTPRLFQCRRTSNSRVTLFSSVRLLCMIQLKSYNVILRAAATTIT